MYKLVKAYLLALEQSRLLASRQQLQSIEHTIFKCLCHVFAGDVVEAKILFNVQGIKYSHAR